MLKRLLEASYVSLESVVLPAYNLPELTTKYNHGTFLALPMLSEQALSRNLCVIVLSFKKF